MSQTKLHTLDTPYLRAGKVRRDALRHCSVVHAYLLSTASSCSAGRPLLLDLDVFNFARFTIAISMNFGLRAVSIVARFCNLVMRSRFRIELLITHARQHLALT